MACEEEREASNKMSISFPLLTATSLVIDREWQHTQHQQNFLKDGSTIRSASSFFDSVRHLKLAALWFSIMVSERIIG